MPGPHQVQGGGELAVRLRERLHQLGGLRLGGGVGARIGGEKVRQVGALAPSAGCEVVSGSARCVLDPRLIRDLPVGLDHLKRRKERPRRYRVSELPQAYAGLRNHLDGCGLVYLRVRLCVTGLGSMLAHPPPRVGLAAAQAGVQAVYPEPQETI